MCGPFTIHRAPEGQIFIDYLFHNLFSGFVSPTISAELPSNQTITRGKLGRPFENKNLTLNLCGDPP